MLAILARPITYISESSNPVVVVTGFDLGYKVFIHISNSFIVKTLVFYGYLEHTLWPNFQTISSF